MVSSSSVLETNMQEAVPATQEAPAYEIRGRTMSLEEWELNVQTENPVDFNSLSHHGCELRSYYEAQGVMDYFNMLSLFEFIIFRFDLVLFKYYFLFELFYFNCK